MPQNLPHFHRDFSLTMPDWTDRPDCPICSGTVSDPYLTCDFSKSCNDAFAGEPQFAHAGVPVIYRRCADCGYLFTRFFDTWSHKDYARHIYNSDYLSADPPADGTRNRALADALLANLPKTLSVLDYGCGDGRVVQSLREAGYDAEGYDPYFGCWSTPPTRQFDVVLCVEVLEHLPSPKIFSQTLLQTLKPGGIIILTTLLIDYAIRSNCWYLSPRNGHAGAHSKTSLAFLFPGIQHVSPATHTIGDNKNALDLDCIGRLVTAAVGTGPGSGQ